ncbi:hypothetical protein C8R45DRAFT_1221404 [Mycena sanguinolenta]|nr:hypothetical protein C8R45DRAFT_1221404 [Mycena sanguinolenta]
MTRTIVVGGGLAGLSAAHTVLKRLRSTLLLDNKPSLAGNSVKASSGINDVGTKVQGTLGIEDSAQVFHPDIAASAGPDLVRPELITALTANSASAVAWFTNSFDIDLSVPGRAPLKKLTAGADEPDAREEIMKSPPGGSRVEGKGATGQLLHRRPPRTPPPALLPLATTNGDHATGDGLHLIFSLLLRAVCNVDPPHPGAKTKFSARGAGELLLDARGARFMRWVDGAKGCRDSGDAMQRVEGAVRLVVDGRAAQETMGGLAVDTSACVMRSSSSITPHTHVDSKPVGHGTNYPQRTQAQAESARVRGVVVSLLLEAVGGLGGLREQIAGCGGGVNAEGNYDEGAKGSI